MEVFLFTVRRSPVQHMFFNVEAQDKDGNFLFPYAVDMVLDDAMQLCDSLNHDLALGKHFLYTE